MTRSTPIFTLIGLLGMISLIGCAAQDQGQTVAPPPVSYSLTTPLNVIEDDPRGMSLLRHDIPDLIFNQKYFMSPLNSIMDVEQLSGAELPQRELAQTQVDLARLSAEEQAGQNPGASAQPPVYTTSFTCQDGNTPVQNAVCENPQLASLDIQLGSLFQQHMGSDSIFERDQVLASKQAWALGLPSACNIPAGITGPPSPAVISCLANAYQAQIAVLTNWPQPQQSPPGNAISHYVTYKLLDDKQPALCGALAGQAAGAMSADGSIDPTQLAGAEEIAGSHGMPSGTAPQGGTIAVDLYRAGLYGGYQIRARSVMLPSATAPVLGPESVGSYLETLPNGGGRYVSFASQTNDYGNIDVFTFQGQLIALLTDVIGYNSPAPPGEAAVAASFILGQNTAAPACLFETYITPPPLILGTFAEQPSLTPFLALIDSMDSNPSAQLAPSDRQDRSYLTQETRWMLFNMPLVVLDQARMGNWTGWLRSRHDQVLDSLFAWSQQSPANLAEFNKLFGLLRPAAVDLDTIYVQKQGVNPNDAAQATALAMMELLYAATLDVSPGLGSGPADPANFVTYKPRYPILASPQS